MATGPKSATVQTKSNNHVQLAELRHYAEARGWTEGKP